MKPYTQLTFIRTLMQFQGIDFINLFKDDAGHKIITSWADLEEGESLWIQFQVTTENVEAYLDGRIPFRTLWQDAPELYLFTTANPDDTQLVTFDEVDKYHPSVDSFYDDMFAPTAEQAIPPKNIH